MRQSDGEATVRIECVAVWYSVVPCIGMYCSMLQCVAVYSSVLHCVAVCCSVLQMGQSDGEVTVRI